MQDTKNTDVIIPKVPHLTHRVSQLGVRNVATGTVYIPPIRQRVDCWAGTSPIESILRAVHEPLVVILRLVDPKGPLHRQDVLWCGYERIVESEATVVLLEYHLLRVLWETVDGISRGKSTPSQYVKREGPEYNFHCGILGRKDNCKRSSISV